MRALVFTAPSVVQVQDVSEPVVRGGEVLIHVRAVGICGSELHGVRKPGFRTPPLVMGHEFAGTTDSGEDVVVNPILSCGQCDLCLVGAEQICRQREIVGVHRQGGFAERVAVPATSVRVAPAGGSWEAAAMVEPVATLIHAWRRADAPAGAKVGIIGAGTMGIMALLIAQRNGAGSIEVVDRSAARTEVAALLGATASGPELAGEFDVVMDAVGSASTRRKSTDQIRPGGTAVWLGLADSKTVLDGASLVRSEKRVVASFGYTPREFDEARDVLPSLDLSWVTSYPLSQGAEVFTSLLEGAEAPMKAVLLP